jgi:hypothetical protein
MPPFRANSKAFFLTFPRCDALPATLATHIKSLGTTSYILVAREKHADGSNHLHALTIFIDKKNIRNASFFDFEGFHANTQTARDRQAVKEYITKHNPSGDDIYEEGSFTDGRKNGDSRAAWLKAKDATTAEEVFSAVGEASPRDFVLSYDRVAAFAATKQSGRTTYVPNPDDIFFLPESLTNWVTNEFTNQVSSLSDIRL